MKKIKRETDDFLGLFQSITHESKTLHLSPPNLDSLYFRNQKFYMTGSKSMVLRLIESVQTLSYVPSLVKSILNYSTQQIRLEIFSATLFSFPMQLSPVKFLETGLATDTNVFICTMCIYRHKYICDDIYVYTQTNICEYMYIGSFFFILKK